MDAKSWIFSLFTGLVLTVAALVHAFLLMWGMEHYKTSVKPYAYALFGFLSLLIVVVAAAFAGPFSNWMAKKLFPNTDSAGLLLCLIGSFLAIVIGIAALFVTMPMVLAIFDDPLPRAGSMMRIRFPEKTRVVYENNTGGGPPWKMKLIVKLDADSWEEFRRNSIFQAEELKITRADNEQNLRDWQTFEITENRAQSYRWTNHNEPALLKVLALRADDGQVYVYLYLMRNVKAA